MRITGAVLAAAAGLALFLSTVGLYGLLSLAVAQRHRDTRGGPARSIRQW